MDHHRENKKIPNYLKAAKFRYKSKKNVETEGN